MGGDKHGYSPQAYQAQPGAPAQHTNAGYQQPYQQHAQYAPPPVQASGMNPKALGGIGIGALLIIVGIGATMYSYDSAADGGSYTIWWGPVLFGVITLIGGIAGLFKR
ncbi:MAG: DUF308 domain-containing protein [Planctomycetes bacterium]|nr:DUF308 domain-containing protein [Planctomycetota bacterium]